MTQAQADQITAERALQKYIVDNGLFKSAVDSAVKAGVITQAQADTILAQNKAGGFGFGGMGAAAGAAASTAAPVGRAVTVGMADAAAPVSLRVALHSRAPSRKDDPFRSEALT